MVMVVLLSSAQKYEKNYLVINNCTYHIFSTTFASTLDFGRIFKDKDACFILLDSYGATELEVAINEALARNVPHPNAVRPCLEQRRESRQQSPPIALDLPDDKRVRDLVVKVST